MGRAELCPNASAAGRLPSSITVDRPSPKLPASHGEAQPRAESARL